MERLALDRFASPWLRRQHVARYRWAAGRVAGLRVLDLACGAGYGSALLRAAGATFVASGDCAPEAFSEAARPGSGAGRLAGVVADAARLPFRAGAFDLYVSFETIEHVEDDRAVVREARRVLAPGGVFLCSTPERSVVSPGRTLADRPDNPFHVREYAAAEFEALLGTGFSRIEWFGQTPHPVAGARRFAAISRLSPGMARGWRRLGNVLRLPFERAGRHAPAPLDGMEGVPEVLIGVCRR